MFSLSDGTSILVFKEHMAYNESNKKRKVTVMSYNHHTKKTMKAAVYEGNESCGSKNGRFLTSSAPKTPS